MDIGATAYAPGEVLKEELEARNWTQVEFSEIIGRPTRLVNEIIAGKKAITPETAVQIGASLDTGAEFWLNLESQYQLSQVTIDKTPIEKKAVLHGRFPIREMVKRSWIVGSSSGQELEQQIRDYFRLNSVNDTPELNHAAKKTSYAGITMIQFAWLFRVEQIAKTCLVPPYQREALEAALPKLRMLLANPEDVRHVSRILADAGVRLVVVEALPGSKIDGACLWLSDTKPVIALSCRLDRIDNFWFVLRHEIEHLLQNHGKGECFTLDEDVGGSEGGVLPKEEILANTKAANFCVNADELENYIGRAYPYCFSDERVRGFASRIGVHPGLVVGQLQKRLNEYKYLRNHLVKVRHLVIRSTPSDGWGNVYSTSL